MAKLTEAQERIVGRMVDKGDRIQITYLGGYCWESSAGAPLKASVRALLKRGFVTKQNHKDYYSNLIITDAGRTALAEARRAEG